MASAMMGKLVSQFPTDGSAPAAAANHPPSVSWDAPETLSEETKNHAFYVRSDYPGIPGRLKVGEFMAQCPRHSDGEGVLVLRDVIFSLGHALLDKVHELEQLKQKQPIAPPAEGAPRYDERLSKALDQLGDKDAEIKELRAALGEASLRIRRLEAKHFGK